MIPENRAKRMINTRTKKVNCRKTDRWGQEIFLNSSLTPSKYFLIPRMKFAIPSIYLKQAWRGSNPQPTDLESVALPIELQAYKADD